MFLNIQDQSCDVDTGILISVLMRVFCSTSQVTCSTHVKDTLLLIKMKSQIFSPPAPVTEMLQTLLYHVSNVW